MPAKKKRPSRRELEIARDIVEALEHISSYTPLNPAYSVTSLRNLVNILDQAEQLETRLGQEHTFAREQAIDAAINVCSTVSEAKVHVVAQFGSDSPVVHVVGLKQKSERKPRAREELVEQ